MKILHGSKIAASTALAVLLLAASPVTAFARGGDDSGSTSGSSSQGSSSSSQSGSSDEQSGTGSGSSSGSGKNTSSSSVKVADTETMNDDANDDSGGKTSGSGSLRERAQQLLEQKRETVHEHTQAQRQKACENHESAIDKRFSFLGTRATYYLNTFDVVFSKVQAYQAKNQLQVTNYDSLVADVNAKQAAAAAATSTLKALSGTKVDCTSTDPASTVASVKTAADDARTALQAYRASLKALVQALLGTKQSSAAANSATDTSGTSTTSTTTTSGSN